MSGLRPEVLEIVEARASEGPRYRLGSRVDFKSLPEAKRPLSGFFVCAFETFTAARDISAAISVKLGLGPSMADDPGGVDNVLGEFLNTVIGLTCSDWADLGLATEFDPPQPLLEHSFESPDGGSVGFHLTMRPDGHPSVSLFLVFLPGGR